jgi:tetratricopeptide (TPR) repeat protein
MLPVVCVAMLSGVGCSQNHQTQKQAATKQWNSARANVLFGLAKEQYANGNFDQSRKTIGEALGMDPDNAHARILSAKLAIEQGQLELAERELDKARKVSPKDAECDYLSGVVYQRWQQPQTAFDFYTSACEKAPAELAFLMAKSEMLVVMGRQSEALTLLKDKVIYFEHSAAIRDAVGQLLVQAGRYGEAADILSEACILDGSDKTIQEHLALAQYYAGHFRDAAEGLTNLMKEKPYSDRPDLLLALGQCQMDLGQVREARRTFESAAQLDGGSSAVWLSLARAAIQLKDTPRAEIALRKAMSLDPASSECRLMLGYLRLQQNKVKDALSAFERASVLDHSDTVSLCMIGYTLQKMGHTDQAIGYYAKALKIKPNDDMARKLMASLDVEN